MSFIVKKHIMSGVSIAKYMPIRINEDEVRLSENFNLKFELPPEELEDSFEPDGDVDDPQVYLMEAARLYSLGLHPHTAFAGMMNFCYDAITPYILQQFIGYGLNIDAEYSTYPNDRHDKVKPIISALEYRQVELVQVLIEAGSKINDKCSINSAVNTALCGHSGDDASDWETCEKLIKILDSASAPRQIIKWVLTDCCDTYIKKSEYLRNYIASCEVCDASDDSNE